MNILLIAPASGLWNGVGHRPLFSGRTFRFSMLSLLSVAAETPPGATIRIVDEQVEGIPREGHFDLVGITAMTAAAPRAYAIADRFRSMGVPVIMGGMHPTFMPDEALQHADAVCAGEAEGIWPRIVEDARAGRLRGIYRPPAPAELSRLKPLPRKLLSSRHYATLQAVQATRGCPHHCAFCSVSAFHLGGFRMRPIEHVVEEIRSLPGRFFILTDDSLAAAPDYAKVLFRALAPLKKHWMTQATLRITDDGELVDLAERAGCAGLFVGLETFSSRNLTGVGKDFNPSSEYRERIALLHAHGIGVEAGIVFGFDGDGPEVFRETLAALDDLRIDMAQISILTPLPGTPYFESMKGRIMDGDWAHFDYHHAVFQLAGMSAEALKAGHDWATRQFYSAARIARRLARVAAMKHGPRVLPYAAAINLAYYGRVLSWGIRGWDPAADHARSRAGRERHFEAA
jgi:radical SAM superfamily enzyme YgiQ (UPF0313 family)